MGDKKRMDNQNKTIKLYTAQTDIVMNIVRTEGVCFSKPEYIKKKYGESAPIFMTAYSWFVKEMEKKVPKPEGAEFPYWAFEDLYSVDTTGSNVTALQVPMEEAVFFDMYDWNKIMQLGFIGKNKAEEEVFAKEISEYGLTLNKIMLTDFYPDLKKRVTDSWQKLFRYDEKVRNGEKTDAGSIQAGMWQIKRDWMKEKEESFSL